MTTFDEHSRDEVFRDYLNEARAAKDYASDAGDVVGPELTGYYIGRGQIHATLAHAAATLLAAMPEVRYQVEQPSEDVARMIEALRTPGSRDFVTEERDALRDRVDELVAQGLASTEPPSGVKHPLQELGEQLRATVDAAVATTPPTSHEPGTAPLCTCGHHSDQHLAVTLPEGDVVLLCELCDCKRYTPNTSEVDGWSEPDARGARFRVARFEQNGHVPPVYFKVTDQLGKREPVVLKDEESAQVVAENLNHMFGSTGTDASVGVEAGSSCPQCSAQSWRPHADDCPESEAQPESPATALVTAAEVAISPQWDDETSSAWTAARAATIAVLRALASTRESFAVYGLADTVGEYLTRMANELEQHTDTPTTE